MNYTNVSTIEINSTVCLTVNSHFSWKEIILFFYFLSWLFYKQIYKFRKRIFTFVRVKNCRDLMLRLRRYCINVSTFFFYLFIQCFTKLKI